MEKQNNVPKLRFPEFSDSWEVKKLGEICRMQAGKFINASEIIESFDTDLYPCYGGNGLRGYSKTFNQEGQYSLIGRQGAHCGNLKLANGKFYATEHALVVSLKDGLDTIFIFYVLNNLSLNQYSTGLAQPGLSVQNLEQVKANISFILPEQQKIATFLRTVDEKLQALKKKKSLLETYKKGVMQKLFSQEIRFKDDEGNDFEDWEVKTLGEVLIKHDEKTTESNQYPILTSARSGIYFQKDYFDGNEVASKDNTGYNVVPRGYFTYRHMSDDTTFKININNLCDRGIVSTLYPVFTTKNVNDYFLQISLNEGIHFKNYALMQKQGGSRTYMYFSKLEQLEIPIPTLPEQTKITNFLMEIDEKINKVDTQIKQTELWKKGLLQQMFV